jgi:hypothetical protein
MSDDPNECREYARRCGELARIAASPEDREHFTSRQKSWVELAALLEVIDHIEVKLYRPIEAAE